MTKLRAPVSYEDALTRIAGLCGWTAMAEALDKAERTVRDYSDPDVPTGISLHDAERLDALYRRYGGQGAPLLDVYALRLEVDTGFEDRDALRDALERLSSEHGEALSALIRLLSPGATEADRQHAIRELQQSAGCQTSTLALLTRSAGLPGGVERVGPEGGQLE